MKRHIFFILFLLAVSGNFVRAQIGAPTTAQRTAKVPILIYHSVRPYYSGITNLVKEYTVPPDIFDSQLKYMKENGFTPIMPDDLADYLVSGKALPAKPFMITFDDGWRNQFRYAFPILQKYRYPGVFYVYSDVIDRKVFLTWDDIKTMMGSGMIIGDHTKSHPELPKITDDALLRQEIIDSKKIIEGRIGKTVDAFAYPFGEYNKKSVAMVEQGGYASARTVQGCVEQSKDRLFTLCGLIITGDFNRFVSLVNK